MDEIDVKTLAARVASGDVEIIDVRESWELEHCAISPCIHLPLSEFADKYGSALSPEQSYAVLCHHGGRSAQATHFLSQRGFGDVANVIGGIDAWALEVDKEMSRY